MNVLHKFETEQDWLAARRQDVTSTEVAALFGLHPYKSRRRLWHEKKGDIEPEFEDNPFTKWGRRLQVPVAMGICEDEGWKHEDLTLFYVRNPELRLGTSLDSKVLLSPGFAKIMEVKVIDVFREEDGWGGNAKSGWTAPTQYEFQLQNEIHLLMPIDKEIKEGVIGALGRRQSTRLLFREYDASVGSMIDSEVEEFWRSIRDNTPPAPDYLADGDILEKLRGPVRVGDIINLTQNEKAVDLVVAYQEADQFYKLKKAAADKAKAGRDAVKTQLMEMIGRNETAVIGDFQISTRVQEREDRVSYGSSFRRFDLKKRKK